MVWLMLLECLLVLSVFFWVPVMRGAAGFFGVRVSEEFYTNEGRAILRQYRVALLLTAVGFGVLALFLHRVAVPWGWVVPQVLLLVSATLLHTYFRQLVQPHRVVITKGRTVASLHRRRLSEYTNVVLELVLVVLLIAPVLILVACWSQLPARIPVHWNFAMQPDRWAARNWRVLALMPMTSVWLQGVMLWVKVSMLQVKMPLPAQNTAQYFELKERSVRLMMRFIDGMRLLLAVLFGTIMLSTIFSALPSLKPLERVAGIVIWACVPVLIGSVIYMIVRSRQLNEQLRVLSGDRLPSGIGDERGWYAGGTFYYNPNDPALFVEKQIGIGLTLNFAHKQALYVMAYLLGGTALLMMWAFTAM